MAVPDPLRMLDAQDIRPEKKIEYTIDLTRSYHNLLQKKEGGNTQSYLWDWNAAGMTEDGKERYYFQDELGSYEELRLIITAQNTYIVEDYQGEKIGLRKEAPETRFFIIE